MANTPFSRNDDERFHTDMGWLSRQGLGHLGYAYREAAEALCDASEVQGRSEEAMYFVASFAFRQSIELYLKAITELVEKRTGTSFPEKKNTHKLLVFWDWINHVLKASGFPSLEQDSRSVVAEFERVDPYGSTFRYNLDRDGKVQLNGIPAAVSLTNLRAVAAEVIHHLDAVETCLSAQTSEVLQHIAGDG